MVLIRIAIAFALLIPPKMILAYEPKSFPINTGIAVPDSGVAGVLSGIVDILHELAFFVMVAVFLVGALKVAASGGRENVVQSGKSIIMGALIGMAITAGSWMILSTFISFLIEG